MDNLLLFGPMIAGLLWWVWAYKRGQRRKALGLRSVSGFGIVLLAIITLPLLLFGGCVLSVLWEPDSGFAPRY